MRGREQKDIAYEKACARERNKKMKEEKDRWRRERWDMRDEVGAKENGGRRTKGEKEGGEKKPMEERWRGGNAEKMKKGVSKRDEHERDLVWK